MPGTVIANVSTIGAMDVVKAIRERPIALGSVPMVEPQERVHVALSELQGLWTAPSPDG